MSKIDIHQFRWVELVNDHKGRTSPSKFIGVISCLISLLTFTLAAVSICVILWFTTKTIIDYSSVSAAFQNIMMQSVALFTLGSALIATNRLTKDKEVSEDLTLNN